MIRSKNFTIF